jgi:hypothetical protein
VRRIQLVTKRVYLKRRQGVMMSGTGNADQVIAWRFKRLRYAGMEPDLAWAVASDCAVDLHAVLGLIASGCEPRLAARITTPMHDERHVC